VRESRTTFGEPLSATLNAQAFSRSDAIKMVGHLTESIYRRYAIADERSIKDSP
jgi:hypothetical protein